MINERKLLNPTIHFGEIVIRTLDATQTNHTVQIYELFTIWNTTISNKLRIFKKCLWLVYSFSFVAVSPYLFFFKVNNDLLYKKESANWQKSNKVEWVERFNASRGFDPVEIWMYTSSISSCSMEQHHTLRDRGTISSSARLCFVGIKPCFYFF